MHRRPRKPKDHFSFGTKNVPLTLPIYATGIGAYESKRPSRRAAVETRVGRPAHIT